MCEQDPVNIYTHPNTADKGRHTHTCACMQTWTHILATHTHAYIHTCHTHTHAYIHTLATHTHTQSTTMSMPTNIVMNTE